MVELFVPILHNISDLHLLVLHWTVAPEKKLQQYENFISYPEELRQNSYAQ